MVTRVGDHGNMVGALGSMWMCAVTWVGVLGNMRAYVVTQVGALGNMG